MARRIPDRKYRRRGMSGCRPSPRRDKVASMRILFLVAMFCAALPARAQQAVFLVRHAEKADASKDPVLSSKGQARARALSTLLRDAGITAIWATDLRRTQLTAQPLAKLKKLEVRVHAAKDISGLVAEVRRMAANGKALVVGHSNTLPEIAAALGVRERIEIADDEYDALLVVVPEPGGGARLLRLRQPDPN